ncbi:hypothetical protein D9753_34125 [Streptomyces dangxiongensis]|uniref:Uncharacterized protein n=1 Tax=Streptomyces dangxiongensis TaxID=1442032 RepID=A0A3G2JKW7_9ACTN|nr:hypothetical protein [Streptomyces dangxiongensis]AYN43088.1 hypothetical protein D9753_34125 [Streptomyces dangxiongensis]
MLRIRSGRSWRRALVSGLAALALAPVTARYGGNSPGYDDNITSVCADSRLDGTHLSLHHYGCSAP